MSRPARITGHATVYQDEDNRWRWQLQAPNGPVVATSAKGYTRREHAVRGLIAALAAAKAPTIDAGD